MATIPQVSITGVGHAGKSWGVGGATTAAKAVTANIDDLVTAMQGVQSGTPDVLGASISTPISFAAITPAITGETTPSKKWAVICKDSTTERKFTKYVPCADFSLADAAGHLDPAGTAGAALVTALTTLFVSPAGNAFTVEDIKKARM